MGGPAWPDVRAPRSDSTGKDLRGWHAAGLLQWESRLFGRTLNTMSPRTPPMLDLPAPSAETSGGALG
eukprot:15179423-Alexandrium_andersonii.AAC.1